MTATITLPEQDRTSAAPISVRSPGRLASRLLAGAAGVVLLSSLLINPWVGKLWRTRPMPTLHDVMLGYFFWSLAIGLLLLLCSYLVVRVPTERCHNIVLFVTVLAFFTLSDRVLLARLGTPFWTFDAKTHFRYRPNAERAPFKSAYTFHTNSYGFLDDEFDRYKKPGELRGLALGNVYYLRSGRSKTEQRDQFSEQLERKLTESRPGQPPSQVINAGVLGHGPAQSFEVLKETADMEPDFLVYAFQEFQLYDYYLLDQTYGGPGLDFHGIMQASNPIVGYLANETGYGRWMNEFRLTTKNAEMAPRFKGRDGYFTLKNLHSDDTLRRAWAQLQEQLATVYDYAEAHHLPMILVMVPFQNQILNSEYRQVFLEMEQNAKNHRVDVIDLAAVLNHMLVDQRRVDELKTRGFSEDAISEMKIDEIATYIQPLNDLTAEGHRLVADKVYDVLASKGLVKGGGRM